MEEQIQSWQRALLFKSSTDLRVILSLILIYLCQNSVKGPNLILLVFNTPVCIALLESSSNDSAAKLQKYQ